MMAKCKSCGETFNSHDGGSGCEHCGAVFCPTCEDMAGVNSCPYCPTAKPKTTTEDRDEPMPAPESPVRIAVAEVTCPEVRHTIAMVLKEQAPGFGITKASTRGTDSTIELWGLWPANSNSGTRASIKVYLDGLMNGIISTYRRQRQAAFDESPAPTPDTDAIARGLSLMLAWHNAVQEQVGPLPSPQGIEEARTALIDAGLDH